MRAALFLFLFGLVLATNAEALEGSLAEKYLVEQTGLVFRSDSSKFVFVCNEAGLKNENIPFCEEYFRKLTSTGKPQFSTSIFVFLKDASEEVAIQKMVNHFYGNYLVSTETSQIEVQKLHSGQVVNVRRLILIGLNSTQPEENTSPRPTGRELRGDVAVATMRLSDGRLIGFISRPFDWFPMALKQSPNEEVFLKLLRSKLLQFRL